MTDLPHAMAPSESIVLYHPSDPTACAPGRLETTDNGWVRMKAATAGFVEARRQTSATLSKDPDNAIRSRIENVAHRWSARNPPGSATRFVRKGVAGTLFHPVLLYDLLWPDRTDPIAVRCSIAPLRPEASNDPNAHLVNRVHELVEYARARVAGPANTGPEAGRAGSERSSDSSTQDDAGDTDEPPPLNSEERALMDTARNSDGPEPTYDLDKLCDTVGTDLVELFGPGTYVGCAIDRANERAAEAGGRHDFGRTPGYVAEAVMFQTRKPDWRPDNDDGADADSNAPDDAETCGECSGHGHATPHETREEGRAHGVDAQDVLNILCEHVRALYCSLERLRSSVPR